MYHIRKDCFDNTLYVILYLKVFEINLNLKSNYYHLLNKPKILVNLSKDFTHPVALGLMGICAM